MVCSLMQGCFKVLLSGMVAMDIIVSETDGAYRQIAHDPEVYTDPLVFKPERFIPADGRLAERDPYDFCFGFGRRYARNLTHSCTNR